MIYGTSRIKNENTNFRKSRDVPLDERIKLYEKAKELHQKLGWGRVRIGKELNINPHTIEGWIHRNVNPSTHFNLFTPVPTPELSYVIGVMFGDGSTTRTGYVHLTCKDSDFAEKFSKCLAQILNKAVPIRRYKEYYYIWLGCKLFRNFFKSSINALMEFIERFPKEFIQGVADSEGSPNITIYKRRNRKRFDVRVVVACSTNLELLKYSQSLLIKYFRIKSNIVLNVKAEKFVFVKGK